MSASEIPGDLKMISLVWFIVNCDIWQQETGICKHSREKNGSLGVYQNLDVVYQRLLLPFL